MAAYIYVGGTPTLRFKPLNGIHVNDASLGTPSIGIVQGELALTYSGDDLVIDGQANTVSVKLPESDTILLVDDVPAQAQLAFGNTETGDVVRFSAHDLVILPSLLGTLVTPEDEYDDADTEDEDGDPYDEETYVDADGELSDIDDWEDYELEDYEEDYEDTLEDDPEELYDIDDVEEADGE